VTISRDGDSDERETTMSYWASGERDHVTKSDGTVEHRYFGDQGLPVLRTERRTGEDAPTSADEDRWHAYTYDRNANRTKDERGTYEYNARDQLTRWLHPGEETAADLRREVLYEPAGDGQLLRTTTKLRKSVSGVVTEATTVVDNEIDDDRLLGATSKTTATSTDGSSVTDNRTLKYEYDALGSTLALKTRNFTGETDPGTGSFELTTQYSYDPFERLLSARDDRNGDGDLGDASSDPELDESGSEVYCDDALDRRDRKITGIDLASINERTACSNPPDQSRTCDYSYLGLTERLTREGTGDGSKTYDYGASGERLGIKARVTGGAVDSKRFRPTSRTPRATRSRSSTIRRTPAAPPRASRIATSSTRTGRRRTRPSRPSRRTTRSGIRGTTSIRTSAPTTCRPAPTGQACSASSPRTATPTRRPIWAPGSYVAGVLRPVQPGGRRVHRRRRSNARPRSGKLARRERTDDGCCTGQAWGSGYAAIHNGLRDATAGACTRPQPRRSRTTRQQVVGGGARTRPVVRRTHRG